MQRKQEVSMATRHLTAFIEGNPVGTLLQDEKGLIYFHYRTARRFAGTPRASLA